MIPFAGGKRTRKGLSASQGSLVKAFSEGGGKAT
jgi:hypothetical protein